MGNEEKKSDSAQITRTQPPAEGGHPDSQAVAGRSGGDVDETRRNLIRAGWVIPAVIAVQLPTATDAFASSTGGVHVDAYVDTGGHVDAHVDVHVDTVFIGAHVDAGLK
jgi:hypothetical protein